MSRRFISAAGKSKVASREAKEREWRGPGKVRVQIILPHQEKTELFQTAKQMGLSVSLFALLAIKVAMSDLSQVAAMRDSNAA